MSEFKRCVVFAFHKAKELNRLECVQFYAFDEDFIWVENEQELSLYKPGYPIIIKDPSQIAQPLSCLDHSHVQASYVSLGCRAYRAGGSCCRCDKCITLSNLRLSKLRRKTWSREVDYSKYVDCWDTINNCWTSLPPMKLGRDSLHLHIFGKELFAIGGYESCDKEFVFIEKFDESMGCWRPLPNPGDTVKLDCDDFVSAAIEHKGFILFGSRACKSFYAYTPPDTWKLMESLPFDPVTVLDHCLKNSAVVVGNHLIWLNRNFCSTLIVFNIEYGDYFKIDLASQGLLPGRESSHYYPQLVHVENDVLVLVWRGGEDLCIPEGEGKGKAKDGEQYNPKETFCSIHCCRFSINFDRARKGEKKCCELISHQRCICPKMSHTLSAAFVVDMPVPVGNPSNSNIASILPQQKGKRKWPTLLLREAADYLQEKVQVI